MYELTCRLSRTGDENWKIDSSEEGDFYSWAMADTPRDSMGTYKDDQSSHDECTERSGRAGRLRVRIARQDSVAISECSESGEAQPAGKLCQHLSCKAEANRIRRLDVLSAIKKAGYHEAVSNLTVNILFADYDTPRNHKRRPAQSRGKARPVMHDESGRILSPAEAKRIRK